MKIWNEHLKESLIATLKLCAGIIAAIVVIITAICLIVLTRGVLLLAVVFCIIWAFVHHEKAVERVRNKRYHY